MAELQITQDALLRKKKIRSKISVAASGGRWKQKGSFLGGRGSQSSEFWFPLGQASDSSHVSRPCPQPDSCSQDSALDTWCRLRAQTSASGMRGLPLTPWIANRLTASCKEKEK